MRGISRSAYAAVSVLGLAIGACSGEVEGGDDNPGNEDPGDEDPGDEDPGDDPDAGADDPDPTDAVPAADARTDRFRCLGEPLPTTAVNPLAVSGTVSEAKITGTSALTGATVEVLRRSGGDAIANGASGSGGSYTLSVNTGGTPLDTYVRASSGSLLKTELFAAAPVTANAPNSSFILMTLNVLDLVAGTVSANQTSGRGAATLSVIDCDGNPVEGATISGFGSARVYYAVDGKPDRDATATGADGLAFVFDVQPGEVELVATIGGESLRPNPITIRANTVALAAIAP